MEESSTEFSFLQVPLMHKTKFADLVGVPVGGVEGWCDRGYISTKVVGKHKLVNLALLTQECLDDLN